MTEEDEKRLVGMLENEWRHIPSGPDNFRRNLLRVAKAAREFRETDELRCGDEVLADGITSIYVGKVTSASGYVCERNGHYVTAMIVRPKPKTERRLLDQVALMQWFTDHDWRPDWNGVYSNHDAFSSFPPEAWQYCGRKIDDIPVDITTTIPEELFEEVEVL